MEDIEIMLGIHDRVNIDKVKGRVYEAAKVIIHPGYFKGYQGKFTYTKNDIAVVKVKKEIRFDFYVRPVCLPHRGTVEYNYHISYITV